MLVARTREGNVHALADAMHADVERRAVA